MKRKERKKALSYSMQVWCGVWRHSFSVIGLKKRAGENVDMMVSNREKKTREPREWRADVV